MSLGSTVLLVCGTIYVAGIVADVVFFWRIETVQTRSATRKLTELTVMALAWPLLLIVVALMSIPQRPFRDIAAKRERETMQAQ